MSSLNNSNKIYQKDNSQIKIYSNSKININSNPTEKKRNFSPFNQNQNLSQNKNVLFTKQEEPERDSLGGGSRVNTKTGSMLNFGAGGGSKMNDNLSVVSRYY